MDDYEKIADEMRDRFLFIGPTPTPNAEDIDTFYHNIDELMEQMRWIYSQAGHMFPTAWIFVTKDPATGAKLDVAELGIVSLVGGFSSDVEKHIWASYLSKIAFMGDAVGIVTAMESWMVQLPIESTTLKDVKPSSHPDRVECLWVSVEHKANVAKPRTLMAEVTRTQNETSLGEFTEHETSVIGKMSGILLNSMSLSKPSGNA